MNFYYLSLNFFLFVYVFNKIELVNSNKIELSDSDIKEMYLDNINSTIGKDMDHSLYSSEPEIIEFLDYDSSSNYEDKVDEYLEKLGYSNQINFNKQDIESIASEMFSKFQNNFTEKELFLQNFLISFQELPVERSLLKKKIDEHINFDKIKDLENSVLKENIKDEL